MSTITSTAWDQLAGVLAYPKEFPWSAIEDAASALSHTAPAGALALHRFEEAIRGLSLGQLQEEYVSTFDLHRDCALELGHHLYGEGPRRNAFLVSLRQAMDRAGLPASRELPDHITSVVALLGRETPARAAGLAALVGPAVDALKGALAARQSPYLHAMDAAGAALTTLQGGG